MANRPETIDETAALVTAAGGRGIALRVDHSVPAEVARLFERVGAFDLLINDIWGGDDLVEWGKKLWQTRLEDGLLLIDRAIKTHIITSHCGLPQLRPGGLVVEVTDGDGSRPHFLRWLTEHMPETAATWRTLDDTFYAYWGKMPYPLPDAPAHQER